jgi:hypothetical protein
MAYFAELDDNNVVIRVISVDNEDIVKDGVEDEDTGIAFCAKLLGGRWLQTSYNNRIRGRYAGPGFTYDPELDEFIAPPLDPSLPPLFLSEEETP